MSIRIPFSPPYIDQDIVNEVVDTLRSGWITTGPKTKQFEKVLADYCNVPKVLCLNSATAGLEIMLRWFGVQEGDEVIVPAYTYCATANVVLHCGAKPVLVDIKNDFLIDPEKVKAAINSRTKAIIPVDIFGLAADYNDLNEVVMEARDVFHASNERQERLGRIMLLADSAHSVGAEYMGKKIGSQADAMVFSFHAVKNLTTAEGGAIALYMDGKFDAEEIYRELNIKSLHGQNKDALSKTNSNSWKYDIVEAGYKYNMPDVLAAIGLASFKQYESHILPQRRRIFKRYTEMLSAFDWAITPVAETEDKVSSCHVYALRIKGASESDRDEIIAAMSEVGISTNVHYQPLPLLSLYKSLEYTAHDYPTSMSNYLCEISLPVYPQLTDTDMKEVVSTLAEITEKVLEKRLVK